MMPKLDQRLVLTTGDGKLCLRGPALRVLLRALTAYCRTQSERIEQAIDDGSLAHADMRAKARRRAEDILRFLSESGLPLPSDYQPSNDLLPSEAADLITAVQQRAMKG